MSNAHSVRRSPCSSRLERSATPPLRLLESSRTLFNFNRSAKPQSWPRAAYGKPQALTCVRLGSWLPINLRRFLVEELGTALRIDNDTIVALEPEGDEHLMRELARAIRRFSFNRAHEKWNEFLVQVALLEAELSRGPASTYPVALCLRCTRLSAGADQLAEHQAPACLAVTLNSTLKADNLAGAAGALVRRELHQVIEDFRLSRTAAGLPHYDLDCYVPNDHVVFTWRPLPVVGS